MSSHKCIEISIRVSNLEMNCTQNVQKKKGNKITKIKSGKQGKRNVTA